MKRELFKFSVVREFPKDSSKKLAWIIFSAKYDDFSPQKNFNINFVVSVFPDPDSPLIITELRGTKLELRFTSLAVEIWDIMI